MWGGSNFALIAAAQGFAVLRNSTAKLFKKNLIFLCYEGDTYFLTTVYAQYESCDADWASDRRRRFAANKKRPYNGYFFCGYQSFYPQG